MSSAMLRTVFLGGMLAFVLSVLGAVEQRNTARSLTTALSDLRNTTRRLQDEYRSHYLEYTMFSDSQEIYQAAKRLGMREPAFADGSLIYLQSEER